MCLGSGEYKFTRNENKCLNYVFKFQWVASTREVAQTCQIQTSIWQLCNLHKFVCIIQLKRQRCFMSSLIFPFPYIDFPPCVSAQSGVRPVLLPVFAKTIDYTHLASPAFTSATQQNFHQSFVVWNKLIFKLMRAGNVSLSRQQMQHRSSVSLIGVESSMGYQETWTGRL